MFKLIDKTFHNFILTILAYFDMSMVYWFNETDIVSKAIDKLHITRVVIIGLVTEVSAG